MAQEPDHIRYYTEWQPTKNLEEAVTGRKIKKKHRFSISAAKIVDI